MGRDEIREELYTLISEQIGIDRKEISDDKRYVEDLSTDSLDNVELVMGLEEHYNIKISEEDARGLTTVGKTLDYLVEKLK